jgi:hypothetical protein
MDARASSVFPLYIRSVLYSSIFFYLAAALNPTEIMNTHPEIVMLESKAQRIKVIII